jgi:hypothetical protein
MKRLPKRPYRQRPARRETPFAGAFCAALIILGAWILSWWIVPIAALIASVLWRGRASVVRQVTAGAVAGWLVLLLIDSLHGRTWALARAAGGAVFLPWGLLFPVTLLFAMGLAWSTGTLVQAIAARARLRRA